MSSGTVDKANTADREIVTTRVFDAPRELVWEAWTNPKHVANWWGPRGFTTTIEQMDVRPGGVWKHTMHGPDGTDYPNKSIFKEVVKPERIVYSHAGGKKGGTGVSFEMTWTFEALGEKTRVTLRHVFATAADRDRVAKEFGAVEGAKQTLDRLGEHLLKVAATNSGDFVMTRIFDAPRELVWKAWTEPKHMAQWWGPRIFTNPICKMDVRPGGTYRIVMRGPDGSEYPASGAYREVVKPEMLVMTINHSELPDEWHDAVNPQRDRSKGKPTLEVVNTITFVELDGKTRLTIRLSFESATVRDLFVKIGMNEGWSSSFDKLDELVAKMKSMDETGKKAI